MFRKLAVWTVVLVAVLSNDALALHQGNPFTPVTSEGQMDDSYASKTKTPMDTPSIATTPASPATTVIPTPVHEENLPTSPTGATPSVPTTPKTPTAGTEPLPVTSSSTTPTVEKGLHVSNCNPNFPSEKPEEAPKATPAVAPMTSDVKPPAPTPAVVKPPTPTPAVVTPATPVQAHTTSTDVADSKTVKNSEETSQQANTQSGNQSGETSTGMGAFAVVGLIAAVAAVGVAVSQVKKSRDADADAALVTPGENENIHIEVKSTPAGGSTIL
ncbi:hypothetical protein KXD40_007662 [Peronospora effusa]|uniref:RxLR effector candidate protein n=1 Tax=Peronospora effusa TaxID=542832 RepID=A0A3M6VR92_9STRA|nr:hypothetical protein DD238_003339 [Peronospora effusa]RQM18622.1 hypothetical protein DD237_001572 [Peronospora effusa]UIZ23640.1 hypothetical protein KXD40_007662 [Peronospora effusa]